MTNDRELLELAAKAAGIELRWHERETDAEGVPHFDSIEWCYIPVAKAPHNRRASDEHAGEVWDPLNDDGDALRLAVKLRICFTYVPSRSLVMAGFVKKAEYPEPCTMLQKFYESENSEGCRRAIVCAAASIGEGMK
jgi:hypothetical protein